MGSDLDPHVVRDLIPFYETANEIKVRVASGRICDLDLFIPALDEQFEERRLLLDGHRVRERLIPVTKVC
jgi:hypothetical protein